MICTFCKLIKDIANFGIKNRKTKNGIKQYYSIYCKSCESIKSKNYRLNNQNKIKEYNKSSKSKQSKKTWLNNNQEQRKMYEKTYYLDNIEKFKEKSQTSTFKENKKLYKKNKLTNDPIFKLRTNISNAILKALKKNKSNKAGQSVLQYLDYTIEELKFHLEKQFNSNMSWKNHGIVWHIDHIIPQSDLPYSSMQDINFKKCWSLDNLRPLDAKQNMIDGARRARHK